MIQRVFTKAGLAFALCTAFFSIQGAQAAAIAPACDSHRDMQRQVEDQKLQISRKQGDAAQHQKKIDELTSKMNAIKPECQQQCNAAVKAAEKDMIDLTVKINDAKFKKDNATMMKWVNERPALQKKYDDARVACMIG